MKSSTMNGQAKHLLPHLWRLQIIEGRKIRPTRYPAFQIHTTVSVQRVTDFCRLISAIEIHSVLPSLHGNTITLYCIFFRDLSHLIPKN